MLSALMLKRRILPRNRLIVFISPAFRESLNIYWSDTKTRVRYSEKRLDMSYPAFEILLFFPNISERASSNSKTITKFVL